MYIYKKLSQFYYKMFVWKNFKRFDLLHLDETAYKKKELNKTMDFLNANQ